MTIDIDPETVEQAVSCAVDVIVAKMDCKKNDADYQERRKYARERLTDYLIEQREEPE